jgi:N-acetylmuramoyl-L-alanine amidase
MGLLGLLWLSAEDRTAVTSPPTNKTSAGGSHRLARVLRRALVLAGLSAAIVVALIAVSPGRRAPKVTAEEAKGHHESDGGAAIDPGYFAPGACTLYRPTSGNRHVVVFLDAGHGGIDPGGTGTTESGQAISESMLTLPVELDTMALLRADGFSVVVSRTADTTVLALRSDDVSSGALTLLGSHDDVVARDVCANDAKSSLLIGIYFDAGASADDAGSLTAYDQDRPFAAQNAKLAQLVQADVVASMNAHGWGIPNDGAVPDTDLGSVAPTESASGLAAQALSYDHLLLLGPAQPGYLDTPSEMPGALIEPLYLTDPFEGSIADSVSGQQAIAQGLAEAIEQYFAPPPSPVSSTS